MSSTETVYPSLYKAFWKSLISGTVDKQYNLTLVHFWLCKSKKSVCMSLFAAVWVYLPCQPHLFNPMIGNFPLRLWQRFVKRMWTEIHGTPENCNWDKVKRQPARLENIHFQYHIKLQFEVAPCWTDIFPFCSPFLAIKAKFWDTGMVKRWSFWSLSFSFSLIWGGLFL